LTKKIIIIDPGHGGSDPGAVSEGVEEKDVNFKIASSLFIKLNDNGYKAKLTRTNDSFIDLYDRVNLANKMKADLFVSIHNNSAFSPEAEGTETLYFPDSQEGQALARLIQNELVIYLKRTDRGIKPRGDLVVLKYTNMPAVLVECAFLSNPVERKLLQEKEFRALTVKAIYQGIDKYLKGGSENAS
jgi:N-acetylmuramoyl-L-alanine amidase